MPPETQTTRATVTTAPTTRARRLSAQECWSQLRSHHEGRLGYLSGRGPRHVVLPYAVRDHELVIRIPLYNEAAQYARDDRVTFDVARLEGPAAERVEVVAHARAAEPGDDDLLPDEQWPADLPSRVVYLEVHDIHGEIEPVGVTCGTRAA